MTLSDALVAMAPLDDGLPAAEQTRRAEAMEIVFRALGRLARRGLQSDHRDEVVSDVLMRLVKSRPGPGRYTSTDAEAEAYLMTSLRNAQRDLFRARQKARTRFVSTEPDQDGWAPNTPVDYETPESVLIDDQSAALPQARLATALDVLFTRAVPAIASTLQNPDGFLENVADLRAIASGELTVDAIVEREGGRGDSFVKVRNRVYQRHKRTRAYLLEAPRVPNGIPRLTEWLRDAQLDPDTEEAVRRVAVEVFTPRVIRGGKAAGQEQRA